MKRMRKAGVLLLLALCMVLLPAMTANAGFRRQSNGKYRYIYNNRTKKYYRNRFKNIKGKDSRGKSKTYTFYFDSRGYMVTGWRKIKGNTYYFDPNGRMAKNQVKSGHYLGKDGKMVKNDWDPYGNYYGEDGLLIPGYKKDGAWKSGKKGMRYRQADGSYVTKTWKCLPDWKRKNGKKYWFYFYSNGYMAKNTRVGSRLVDKYGHWHPSRSQFCK